MSETSMQKPFFAKSVDLRWLQRQLPLFLILCIALVLRLWGIGFGLPHRTHIDEPAYVVSALKLASGQLRIEYPLFSPSIYQVLLLFQYGILFLLGRFSGSYGSVADFAHSYQVDPTMFYLLGRFASVVASLMTIIILFLLVERLMGRQKALVASAFLALNFIDVRHAHFAEPYSLIGLLVLASVYFAVVFMDNRDSRVLVGSAGLAGGAVALRFSTFPVVSVPLLTIYAIGQSSRFGLRGLLKYIFVVGLGLVIGFCLAYPGIFVAPDLMLNGIKLYATLAAGQAGFDGFSFGYPFGAAFYLDMFLRLLGIPFLCVVVIGMPVSVAKLKEYWIVVFAFPVLYFIVVGISKMAFLRYAVVLLPFVALLSALGTMQLSKWLCMAVPRAPKELVRVAVLFSVLGVSFVNVVQQNALFSTPDTRLLAKQWVEANLPEGVRIATQWYGPPLSTQNDPEAGSQRVYDVEVMNPFQSTPELYTLSYYRDRETHYVILSSFIYQLTRVNVQEDATRMQFYESLDQEATLVASFSPFTRDQNPPFVFDEIYGPVVSLWQRERPGPVIKIYRLTR